MFRLLSRYISLSKSLTEATATLINRRIECSPLGKNLQITFKHRTCLRTSESHLVKKRNEILKEQSIDAMRLPIGMNSNKQQFCFLLVFPFQGT